MRKAVSILLALLVWASSSGIAAAAHHATFEHDGAVTHDETACRVCNAIHAPIAPTPVPTLTISLDRQPGVDASKLPIFTSQSLPFSIACRGPPAC